MKKIFLLFTVAIIIFSLGKEMAEGQKVRKIQPTDLEEILKSKDDRLYVVNFWATWCAPCVRELPYFEKMSKTYDPEDVRFIMVSLDFPSDAVKKLKPFLVKNRISLDIDLMQDPDYDKWIALVDQNWYGNLPATLIFNNSKKIRIFHPGEVDEAGLRKMIDANIN